MRTDQKIVVTGGRGIVSTYVMQRLLLQGYTDITAVSRSGNFHPELDGRIKTVQSDIRDIYPLREILDSNTILIHTAAKVSYDPRQRAPLMSINIEGTANLINLALEKDVTHFIHVSSIAALGRSKEESVIHEDTEWSDEDFNTQYAVSKYKAELEVWRGQEEGLPVSVINPGIILGSGVWDQSSSEMFSTLSKGLSYYPAGSTGVVDARDVAAFIYKLITSKDHGERYILVGKNISYYDLFGDIATALDKKPPSKILPIRKAKAYALLESIRCRIMGKSPVITRQSIISASHQSKYDNSKSLTLQDFSYTDYAETVRKCCDLYKKRTINLLPIKQMEC